MPKFTPKSHEQILAAMVAKLVSRTTLSDVGDASVLKHMLSAAARQDAEQYYQMTLLLNLFSIDTATGEDLDGRAKDIQPGLISRLPSNKAVGSVVFTRKGATGSISIPVGTRVKTADGKVFVSTTLGSITPSSAEQISGHGIGRDSNYVSIAAAVAGANGNVASYTINKFESKPAGVEEVVNPSSCSQGRDLETDDSFRARLKAYVASLARCTVGSIEAQIIGQQDPVSGATALFVNVWEDPIDRGNILVYVDDGTGTAESIAYTKKSLTGTWTWNGTTTVLTTDTSGVVAGEFIGKDSDPTHYFQIQGLVPNTSVTLLNPGVAAIPTGAGASSKATENVTLGLAGPPPDTAVGGETTLWLNNKPVKGTDVVAITSATRGLLVRNTDYLLLDATGQLDFLTPLVTGERIEAAYTYNTGLIAFVQKIVDGDPNDRLTYPGLRAAGIYALVKVPQVLLQNVTATVTVSEGYDQTEAKDKVRQAIKDYINTLPISGDLIRATLIQAIMGVEGIYDVILTTPAANVAILDDQMARTTDSNIIIA